MKLPSGEQILRKWMVYSHEKKSLFCFCCKLFDKNDNLTTKSSFITGFNSWWKLNPKVSDHENSELHIINLEKWKTLEARLLQNKTIDAAHQDVMEREKKKWRDILHRLLHITLFLAKQNLPIRGHREDFVSENRGDAVKQELICENVEVKELFLGFIPLSGKKADSITQEIVQSLEKDGLDLKLCRSQGYDNATTMSGIHTGVQTRIKEFNPKEIFVPCANHSLNLCGVHAFGSVSVCVTFFGTLESVYTFFSCSTHRWEVLKETVGVTVKRLNDTRWSAHHDAVKPIFKHFEKLVKAVEKLCDASKNLDTRGAAEVLMTNICNFNFLCFLLLWYHILLEVNHAQKHLQIEGISLEKCCEAEKLEDLFSRESRSSGP
ncbi:52 kDa repressor of the inhibitor of the protein kinase-like [Hydra vulgaris]|uniref:52 kDa repressor of the inhibitor of the protein kinase-like n=1 Tax=Hydra vulgaris TaxID=6087 RepID=A0ABM4D180_HYDVU